MVRFSLLAFACLALSTSPALGHNVGLAFTARGNQIEVEAFYDDDSPAHKAIVKVMDDNGTIVTEGMTDAKGLWVFPSPKAGSYTVHLDAGAGHRTKKKLTVPVVQKRRDPLPNAAIEPTPIETPSIETRDEQTRTPWARIGLGLAFIGGATATLLLLRQSRRTSEPDA